MGRRLHIHDFAGSEGVRWLCHSDNCVSSSLFYDCVGETESSEDGVVGDYEGVGGGDVTQVAPRPDAGALVEQITYLTSWPQTTPPVSVCVCVCVCVRVRVMVPREGG